MIIAVLKMALPIIIAFSFGIFARKRRIFDESGCQTIKDIVSKIMMPIVLVNAFMFADYSLNTLVIILAIFVSVTAIFFLGFVIRKFFPTRGKYLPFLLSTFECGTIGYPLLTLLFSQAGASNMAIIDVGHTVFFFAIAVPILQMTDSPEVNIKESIKSALTTPIFISMLLGITLGLIGVDKWLAASSVYEIYTAIVDFITAPAGMLILLAIGYDVSVNRELIKPILLTVAGRLALMAVFCILSIFVISRFKEMDPVLLYSLIFTFALPVSYGDIVFGKFEGHKDYVSATISFSTLVTIFVFIIISALTQI